MSTLLALVVLSLLMRVSDANQPDIGWECCGKLPSDFFELGILVDEYATNSTMGSYFEPTTAKIEWPGVYFYRNRYYLFPLIQKYNHIIFTKILLLKAQIDMLFHSYKFFINEALTRVEEERVQAETKLVFPGAASRVDTSYGHYIVMTWCAAVFEEDGTPRVYENIVIQVVIYHSQPFDRFVMVRYHSYSKGRTAGHKVDSYPILPPVPGFVDVEGVHGHVKHLDGTIFNFGYNGTMYDLFIGSNVDCRGKYWAWLDRLDVEPEALPADKCVLTDITCDEIKAGLEQNATLAPMNITIRDLPHLGYNVTCNEGFYANGHSSFEYFCVPLTVGVFWFTRPDCPLGCLPKICPALTAPANTDGHPSADLAGEFCVGDIVTFFCDDGYGPETVTRTCVVESGQIEWQGDECQKLQCNDPTLGDGETTPAPGGPYDVGTELEVTCADGDHAADFHGSYTLKCQERDYTAIWVLLGPGYCQEIDCGDFDKTIEFATKVDDLTYECIDGFEPADDSDTLTVSCVIDDVNKIGYWNISSYCEAILCAGNALSLPPQFQEYYPVEDYYNVNTSVTAVCKKHTTVDENKNFCKITCNEDGNWQFALLGCNCTDVTCDDDPFADDSNANFPIHGNTIGDVAWKECHADYHISDGFWKVWKKCIQNGLSGEWFGQDYACEEIDCADAVLMAGTGTTIVPDPWDTFLGATVTIECADGDSIDLECENIDRTGMWVVQGQNDASCGASTCGAPPPPGANSHQLSNISAGNVYDMVFYKCDANHALDDVNQNYKYYVTCFPNGTWSDTKDCVEIPCENRTKDCPDGENVVDGQTDFLQRAFVVDGCCLLFDTQNCTDLLSDDDGGNSDDPPGVGPPCFGYTPDADHVDAVDDEYECADGFSQPNGGGRFNYSCELNEDAVREIELTAGDDGFCIPNTCNEPNDPNGVNSPTLTGQSFVPGDEVTICCKKGFTTNAGLSYLVTCQDDGTWDIDPQNLCQEIKCDNDDKGLAPAGQQTPIGGTATLVCPYGDDITFTCVEGEDGAAVWQPSGAGTCKNTTCGMPPQDTNAYRVEWTANVGGSDADNQFGLFPPGGSFLEFPPGVVLTVYCKDCYYVSGAASYTLTCEDDGTWTSNPDGAMCSPLYCDLIDPPTNGNVTPQIAPIPVGSQATLTCDEDHYFYKHVKSIRVNCIWDVELETARWEPTPPTVCDPIVCTPPEPFCPAGFDGNLNYTCEIDDANCLAFWLRIDGQCTVPLCSPPPAADNAYPASPEQTSYNLNFKVVYVCHVGHHAGDKTWFFATCDETGWNLEGNCTEITKDDEPNSNNTADPPPPTPADDQKPEREKPDRLEDIFLPLKEDDEFFDLIRQDPDGPYKLGDEIGRWCCHCYHVHNNLDFETYRLVQDGASAVWLGPLPGPCKRIQCKVPEAITPGTPPTFKFIYCNESMHYTCPAPFTGQFTYTCDEVNKTGCSYVRVEGDVCMLQTCDIMDISVPQSIGPYPNQATFTNGEKVLFRCEHGYHVANGDNQVIAECVNGNWQIQGNETCTRMMCDTTTDTNLQDDTTSSDSQDCPGNTVAYPGEDTRFEYCLEDNDYTPLVDWTHDNCTLVDCALCREDDWVTPGDTTVDGGSSITVGCNGGLVEENDGIGNSDIEIYECTRSAAFFGELSHSRDYWCVEQTCNGSWPVIPNAKPSSITFDPVNDGVCSCQFCEADYHVEDGDNKINVTCTDGTWSASENCEEIECTAENMPFATYSAVTPVHVGDEIKYTCDDTSAVRWGVDEITFKCWEYSYAGNMSAFYDACSELECDPVDPADKKLVLISPYQEHYSDDETATYTCFNGTQTINVIYTCKIYSNGTWGWVGPTIQTGGGEEPWTGMCVAPSCSREDFLFGDKEGGDPEKLTFQTHFQIKVTNPSPLTELSYPQGYCFNLVCETYIIQKIFSRGHIRISCEQGQWVTEWLRNHIFVNDTLPDAYNDTNFALFQQLCMDNEFDIQEGAGFYSSLFESLGIDIDLLLNSEIEEEELGATLGDGEGEECAGVKCSPNQECRENKCVCRDGREGETCVSVQGLLVRSVQIAVPLKADLNLLDENAQITMSLSVCQILSRILHRNMGQLRRCAILSVHPETKMANVFLQVVTARGQEAATEQLFDWAGNTEEYDELIAADQPIMYSDALTACGPVRNPICSLRGQCVFDSQKYHCRCRSSYIDVNPTSPGTRCVREKSEAKEVAGGLPAWLIGLVVAGVLGTLVVAGGVYYIIRRQRRLRKCQSTTVQEEVEQTMPIGFSVGSRFAGRLESGPRHWQQRAGEVGFRHLTLSDRRSVTSSGSSIDT